MGTGVMRLEREADRSSPSNTEDKNAWSYTFTPSYIFMTLCITKHRENFILKQKMTLHAVCSLMENKRVTETHMKVYKNRS
jgi:hypothetical protein